MKPHARFIWAADVLNIQAGDSVLEIGCGAGLLVEQLSKKITIGKILGIDQSEAMLQKALVRNQTAITQGKVKLVRTSFLQLITANAEYNKVAAFNVNFFWKNPERELAHIAKMLTVNGQLFIFHQSPYEITIDAAEPVIKKLMSFSYEIIHTAFKSLQPTSAFCIIAKPSSLTSE